MIILAMYISAFGDALLSDSDAAKRRERKQKLIALSRNDVIDYTQEWEQRKTKLEVHLNL